MRPNLFIIGSMKSGTTSLHNLLAQHPDIFMSTDKEPGYFVPELNLHQGEQWYLDLFKDARGVRYSGESSTHYTKSPHFSGVPERIKLFAPEAKLIYVMRDPLYRAVSHYYHNLRKSSNGYNPAFELEFRNMHSAFSANTEYFDISYYAMQIQLYLEYFDLDQMYLMTFENLRDQTKQNIEDLLSWLGVDTTRIDAVALPKNNTKPDQFERLRGRGLLHKFRYSRFWDYLSPACPSQLKSWARNHISKKDQGRDDSYGEAMEYMTERLSPTVRELEDLLQRKFPEWSL